LGTSTVCPTPQNLHNFLNFQSIFEQTGNWTQNIRSFPKKTDQKFGPSKEVVTETESQYDHRNNPLRGTRVLFCISRQVWSCEDLPLLKHARNKQKQRMVFKQNWQAKIMQILRCGTNRRNAFFWIHSHYLDFLPVKCYGCSKMFCSGHFTYEAHNCESGLKTNAQVPVCPLCNQVLDFRILLTYNRF
jgi:hypothetical protein